MSEPDFNSAALIEYVDKHLDDTLDRLEKGYTPVWEALTEQATTIVTLASGTLVLSISFLRAAAPGAPVAPVHARWCLPTSWCLFGLCALLGATRHGWASNARSMRARLESQRGKIRVAVGQLTPGPNLSVEFDAILEAAMTSASVDPDRAIKIVIGLSNAMYWSFAFGLIFLLTFAILNLPF